MIRHLTALMGVICALILGVALAGCSNRDEPTLLTGKILLRDQIRAEFPLAHFGDQSYAVVNSAWVEWYQGQFESEMYRLGNPMRWDARADCNRFAAKWAADAQARYLAAAWHSSVSAQALAIGEVWGVREDGSVHAVVAVYTERGLIYWEPQSAKNHEIQSFVRVIFCRF